ncbi:hypothetical protein SAMN06265374_4078 [Roseibium denhamense]|uniref:Uncharacterized protein n=1 Tax=Roseibium denhamense TaxID=76305 RepID=A0ABY1PM82_9HYPH|nr:hypothetical protein SAMN06265374_4078 [Roseibium denhamense]
MLRTFAYGASLPMVTLGLIVYVSAAYGLVY